MGSRGAGSSGGPVGGNGNSGSIIKSTSSLISARERFQGEVDEALTVLRDVERAYGAIVEDMHISKLTKRGAGVLGYYDARGNIGINEKVFGDAKGLTEIYDRNVKSGYHPPRGNKTGLQAVIAHELGHRLNYIAGGSKWENLDRVATDIIGKATKNAGYKSNTAKFRASISGYATSNNAEAVAESFADVYCNGNRAKNESKAVVSELNKYFRNYRGA